MWVTNKYIHKHKSTFKSNAKTKIIICKDVREDNQVVFLGPCVHRVCSGVCV